MSNAHRHIKLTAHAHCMRQALSEPERLLWQVLRSSQLGVQFLRQVVLHGFVVDFFAPSVRLAVEVDGAHHARKQGADKRRDRALAAHGLRVLRLPAHLVLKALPEALAIVRRELLA
jgi:very-short-patch-repair endonuclease